MKKMVLLSLVVLLVGLMSMGVLAVDYYGVQVWQIKVNNGVEEAIALDGANGLARAYTSEGAAHPAGGPYGCNTTQTINWTTEVQVAQWLYWQVDATKWNWYVRKPGTYYADCIGGFIRSNGDVRVSFSGFDDLKVIDGEEAVNDTIQTWYGFDLGSGMGPQGVDWSGWLAADLLPVTTFEIPDSEILHNQVNFKLWNKIEVVNCNSAATFRNSGVITLTLANQQEWIVDGAYDPAYTY